MAEEQFIYENGERLARVTGFEDLEPGYTPPANAPGIGSYEGGGNDEVQVEGGVGNTQSDGGDGAAKRFVDPNPSPELEDDFRPNFDLPFRADGVASNIIKERLAASRDAINAGLGMREEELLKHEEALQQSLAANAGNSQGGAGQTGLLGAIIHALKSDPNKGTRADLHHIAAKRIMLQNSRKEINLAFDNFHSEATKYADAVETINFKTINNLDFTDFKVGAGKFAKEHSCSVGHLYGRFNDPMDCDEALAPFREQIDKLNNNPDFKPYCEAIARHSAMSSKAMSHLTHLLNNEGLMSDVAFQGVEANIRHLEDAIETTDFPVKGANVHAENSHIKAAVKNLADVSAKIAEAIVTAIRNLASAFRGPAAAAESPGVEI